MSGASASDNLIAEPGAAKQAGSGAAAAACGDLLSRLVGGKGKRNSGSGKDAGPAARCGGIGARSETVVGTRAGDRLKGGMGSQRIRARSGNDRIKAGPGRDCLLGDSGRDRLHAADGRREWFDVAAGETLPSLTAKTGSDGASGSSVVSARERTR